jgi:hypothetical protein
LSIQLVSGANVVNLADGDNDGVVTYIGAIGVWTVNVTTGLGSPLLGGLSLPVIHLNSVDVSSQNGGTLYVRIQQLGNSSATNPLAMQFAFGGATNGTVNGVACANAVNSVFNADGTTNACDASVALGPFSTAAFSGIGGLIGNPNNIGMLISITHGAGVKTTSIDAELSGIPEPGTYALMGFGLAGLAFLRRRR